MRNNRSGITLTELVVSIGIIGVMSFLIPVLVRLFNTLSYLQQKSLLQKEAKAVLWQMSHEVSNAVKVEVPGFIPKPGVYTDAYLDCQQPTAYAFGTTVPNANYACMRIWVYDYERFNDDNKFENPAMYTPPLTNPQDTFGRIIYEVLDENLPFATDFNGNGTRDAKPYLLRTVKWKTAWGARPANHATRQTYFAGRIRRISTTPRIFDDIGGQQIFKITLPLRSSFDKPTDKPRYFAAIMTMTSKPLGGSSSVGQW